MTDETINNYLGYANSVQSEYVISITHLKANIYEMNAWSNLANKSHFNKYHFYLIRDTSTSLFIGIILDMWTDLHAYIQDQYRRQAITYDALSNIVIPHMVAARKGKPLELTASSPEGEALIKKLEKNHILDPSPEYLAAEAKKPPMWLR